MLSTIREKPAVGYSIAGVALLLAALFVGQSLPLRQIDTQKSIALLLRKAFVGERTHDTDIEQENLGKEPPGLGQGQRRCHGDQGAGGGDPEIVRHDES